MKKIIPMLVLTGSLYLLFQSFQPSQPPVADIPENVEEILVSSCYDCHTTGAKAKDAVKALDFKVWDEYRLTKQIALLGDISKILEEGKMPPKKYLEYNPEKKLSEEQIQEVVDWTKTESEKLMEGN